MIRRYVIWGLLVAGMPLACWGQVTGDVDGDGIITSADMDLVCGATEYSEELDLDGDGTVTNDAAFLLELTGYQRGDSNFDGLVQFKDFVKHSANFGIIEALWSDGDFDCDGQVAFADFLEIHNNYGEFADVPTDRIASVPEPASVVFLTLAMLAWPLRKRRSVAQRPRRLARTDGN